MQNATMNGQVAVEIDFNISDRHYEYDVFKRDCNTKVEDVLSDTKTETDLGNGFKQVDISLSINQTEIEGSETWTPTIEGGEIDFCIVMTLYLNETSDVIVNFKETYFKIIADKTTSFSGEGFVVSNIMTSPVVDFVLSEKINIQDLLTSYQCQDNNVPITQDLTQGAILQVCIDVVGTGSLYEIEKIFEFNITQGSKNTLQIISNNGEAFLYPTITEVSYNNGGSGIFGGIKFQLLGSFFDQSPPEPLLIVGKAKLKLNRRRLSLLLQERALEDVDSEPSFSFQVRLVDETTVDDNTSGVWDNSGNIFSSAILTILAVVYNM